MLSISEWLTTSNYLCLYDSNKGGHVSPERNKRAIERGYDVQYMLGVIPIGYHGLLARKFCLCCFFYHLKLELLAQYSA